MKGVWESRSAEERKAIAAKRIENSDLSAAAQKAIVTLGPEGLSDRAHSGWDARWAKALKLAEDSGNLEKIEEIRARLVIATRVRKLSADDLLKLQGSLAAGVALNELATQLGLPYMALYRVLRSKRAP